MMTKQKSDRQFVIAPAGHGKTEEISKIVADYDGDKKILVLTHTNAGVLSLRNRIKKNGKANNKNFEISTIDSFSLKHALRFPSVTNITKMPEEDSDYDKLRAGIVKLSKTKYFQSALEWNYHQIIVDEYQDCNLLQNELIINISTLVPCLIFGDPMQGIFSMKENTLVDWGENIFPVFAECTNIKLDTPCRWNFKGNPKLGEQIKQIRGELEAGNRDFKQDGEIDTSTIKGDVFDIKFPKKIWEKINGKTSLLILINDRSQEGAGKRKLAEKFKGLVQVIDCIDFKPFFDFLRRLETKQGNDLCDIIKAFIKLCVIGASPDFQPICRIRKGAMGDCSLEIKGDKEKQSQIRELCHIVKRIINSENVKRVEAFLSLLDVVEKNKRYFILRRDIWSSAKQAANIYLDKFPDIVLEDAGRIVRRKLSFGGRKYKRIVATTLLTKGLEYDTVIILDSTKLAIKDLYVAISRAKNKLIIINHEQPIERTIKTESPVQGSLFT